MFFGVIDHKQIDKVPVSEFGGPISGTKEKMRTAFLINQKEALVGVEDFLPGTEVHWAFYHDELHLILGGEAELTYSLPPNYNKIKKRKVGKDEFYIIVQGARVTFKVLGDQPYRHFYTIMPRYHYEKYLLKEDY